ncbi:MULTISPECIES: hypothetical protein [Arthrobacter]|uniref:Uncharacterized protein n=1 Tax=Arthrobacter terricola TaxID=2547396 RepID=A0A4R5K933_9MICC|nr:MULTISPECIES: hypothetical protein [Arthrobacter]MBT8163343.1 hypothetical protein [Arthrobacter sp. GN70]TDF90563.1 hypothetical protein E1809_22150 [Arthrobacter terricola]
MTSTATGRGPKALPVTDPVRGPVYPSYTGPAGNEPPVDAEWWEDVPASSPGGSGWRESWDRAREFFATRSRRRQEEQDREREAKRGRMNQAGELSGREQLMLLRGNIRAAGEDYMDSLRRSKIHAPGFNDDERFGMLDMAQRIYVQQMVTVGMEPLQNGVNPASVVRVMSTMAAMYLLSSTFREVVDEKLEPVSKAIQARIDAKAESTVNRAQQKAAAVNDRIDRRNGKRRADGKDGKQHVDARTYVAGRWQKRYDELRYRERGHREMYTARSAGLTEMALTENAFHALREPGAKADRIMSSYTAMISRLYRQAGEDGLAREEVAEASRIVLGERLRQDPRIRLMFDGLAHGQHRMAPPREERVAGTSQVQNVWRGYFEDYTGKPVDPTRYETLLDKQGNPLTDDEGEALPPRVAGAFTLREQMGDKAHRDRMQVAMTMTLMQAAERGDLTAFNQDLAAYMGGCIASARTFDGDGLPEPLQERLFQSRTMQAAMDVDGIKPRQQRVIYSQAYAEATAAIDSAYPEFAVRWREKCGAGWQRFTGQVGVDPEAAYKRWAEQQETCEQRKPGRGHNAPGPAGHDDCQR